MKIFYNLDGEEKVLAHIDDVIRPIMVIGDNFNSYETMLDYFKKHPEIKVYDEYNIQIFNLNSLSRFLNLDNNKNKYKDNPLNDISKDIDNEDINILNLYITDYYEDNYGYLWIKDS